MTAESTKCSLAAAGQRYFLVMEFNGRVTAMEQHWGVPGEKGTDWGSGFGSGVSVITRKRLEMKNEQISMERIRCHKFLCVLQNRSWNIHIHPFPLQVLKEHTP